MPLLIIGAGFGRTGTSSLRAALEILGFPCYHMDELMAHPQDLDFWVKVTSEPGMHNVDVWDQFLSTRQYTAAIDAPANCLYKELAAMCVNSHPTFTHLKLRLRLTSPSYMYNYNIQVTPTPRSY
jgi:hypothetical protein